MNYHAHYTHTNDGSVYQPEEGHYRGLVSMGSMGSAEPINFETRVLEPINFWGNSIETHILTLNCIRIR